MQSGHRILALMFELCAVDGRIRLLIAWIDHGGNSRYLVPVHPDKSLMNARSGDAVIFRQAERLVIRRIKPWRTTECKDEKAYREITCGEDWEHARNHLTTQESRH